MSDITVVQSQAPMSSVQIEGRAKGPPAITVKVYAESVEQAARIAQEQYDALVRKYDPSVAPLTDEAINAALDRAYDATHAR